MYTVDDDDLQVISVDKKTKSKANDNPHVFFSEKSNNPFSPPLLPFSSSLAPTSSSSIPTPQQQRTETHTQAFHDKAFCHILKRKLPLAFRLSRPKRKAIEKQSAALEATVDEQQATEVYLDDPQMILDDALTYIRRLTREVDIVKMKHDKKEPRRQQQELEDATHLAMWKGKMEQEEEIFNKNRLSTQASLPKKSPSELKSLQDDDSKDPW
ncbi:unnamed protein product [Absidia cylindrospora]